MLGINSIISSLIYAIYYHIIDIHSGEKSLHLYKWYILAKRSIALIYEFYAINPFQLIEIRIMNFRNEWILNDESFLINAFELEIELKIEQNIYSIFLNKIKFSFKVENVCIKVLNLIL